MSFETGNMFETEKIAKFYRQKQIYIAEYKRYLLDNEIEPVNWEDREQCKHYAFYNYVDKEIEIDWETDFRNQGSIYTTRRESIEEFAKLIGEDNFIKYILIGEYREE